MKSGVLFSITIHVFSLNNEEITDAVYVCNSELRNTVLQLIDHCQLQYAPFYTMCLITSRMCGKLDCAETIGKKWHSELPNTGLKIVVQRFSEGISSGKKMSAGSVFCDSSTDWISLMYLHLLQIFLMLSITVMFH